MRRRRLTEALGLSLAAPLGPRLGLGLGLGLPLAGAGGLPAAAAGPDPQAARQDAAPATPPTTPTTPPPAPPRDTRAEDRVAPQRTWRWPRDHGAHPSTAIEWWYVTGWLSPAMSAGTFTGTSTGTSTGTPTGLSADTFTATRPPSDTAASPSALPTPAHGFQITFFRSRTGLAGRGRWAPRQLLFAHAALTTLPPAGRAAGTTHITTHDAHDTRNPAAAGDPHRPDAAGAHRHAQRVMRWNGDPALPEAHAALDDTRLRIGPWQLQRREPGGPGTPSLYQARLMAPAEGFGLALDLRASQPLLLQGDQGWSRKGPQPQQASCYLTEPQLQVSGRIWRDGREQAVQGRAWLDHEWSDSLLDPQASGWDWIGINLADGSALTAFRLRRPDDHPVWGGGSWRSPGRPMQPFAHDALDWQPLRVWRSPHTGIRYPVAWRVRSRAPMAAARTAARGDGPSAWTADGRLDVEVHALLDAQELDSRASTGAIYWEGLVELCAGGSRQRLGLGYLEMTGRGERLMLGGSVGG
ncbi:MAG: hypothetical protein RLY78_333 [Pseudomonadota bacterium]